MSIKTDEQTYKIVNGTAYHKDTPETIIAIMEDYKERQTRLRFHWGDPKTGEDWGDVYDVAGRIGRSTGTYKIPLLIKTDRSLGGGAILDNRIVKITTTKNPKAIIYQHPKYHLKQEA